MIDFRHLPPSLRPHRHRHRWPSELFATPDELKARRRPAYSPPDLAAIAMAAGQNAPPNPGEALFQSFFPGLSTQGGTANQ